MGHHRYTDGRRPALYECKPGLFFYGYGTSVKVRMCPDGSWAFLSDRISRFGFGTALRAYLEARRLCGRYATDCEGYRWSRF